MAQSQLSSPYAEGRQTPRNQLRVDVSESEQMETENEISGNESTYTPRKGTKTRSQVMGTSKNTPFRGTRKSPVQGTRNNTDIGVRSSSESPERERLRTKRKRKYKESSDESSDNLSSSESNNSSDSNSGLDSDTNFDPSSIIEKGSKVPKKITKYIAKYANQGISKKIRQEVTKNCGIPNSKQLQPKQTDRFVKKIFRKKFNQPLSDKKERTIINTQSIRILDATGSLAILWNEAEKLKKRDKGVDPVDVINIVQRALVLIGNAHFVFMTDRRKGLLSRILPDCVDLVDDSMAKKALLKSKNY